MEFNHRDTAEISFLFWARDFGSSQRKKTAYPSYIRIF